MPQRKRNKSGESNATGGLFTTKSQIEREKRLKEAISKQPKRSREEALAQRNRLMGITNKIKVNSSEKDTTTDKK